MITQVALLRGINVGGKNSLPMQDLRAIFSELACENISTYIQSGNVVFKSSAPASRLSREVTRAIEKRFGFSPLVLVMPAEKFQQIVDASPYVEDVADPKHLHIGFLSGKPDSPDIERMRDRSSASERFTLTDDAFYLHAPDGVGRSKLASDVEKCVGVQVTARNWRTVCKLAETALSALGTRETI